MGSPNAISPVAGLLEFLAVLALVCAVLWLLAHLNDLFDGGVLLARRLHVLPEPTSVTRHPIERVAADIRRIGQTLDEMPERTPWTRRRGVLAAYDNALADACRALEIPQQLCDLPLGTERDLHRIVVEGRLEMAGLVIRPARRR